MKLFAAVFLLFCIIPAYADSDIEEQILDAQIAKLEKEIETKYKTLEKCAKENHNYKIAGVATLAATGVGIYANVKLNEKLLKISGGGSGSDGTGVDMRNQEQKNCDACDLLPDIEGCPCQ